MIYFENWQGAPCSYRKSRNRMMNTFIIVNIAPISHRCQNGSAKTVSMESHQDLQEETQIDS